MATAVEVAGTAAAEAAASPVAGSESRLAREQTGDEVAASGGGEALAVVIVSEHASVPPALEGGQPMRAILELHLTCAAGNEVECAKHLAAEIRGAHWAVLVALAAELLHEHENRSASTVIVVAGPSNADRVLKDLQR